MALRKSGNSRAVVVLAAGTTVEGLTPRSFPIVNLHLLLFPLRFRLYLLPFFAGKIMVMQVA